MVGANVCVVYLSTDGSTLFVVSFQKIPLTFLIVAFWPVNRVNRRCAVNGHFPQYS